MIEIHSRLSPVEASVGTLRIVPNGCGTDNGAATWRFSRFSTIHRPYYYYYR